MLEVETWLRDLKLNSIEPSDDEAATVANIKNSQDEIAELLKKEKKLSAIRAKCDNLGDEHPDVKEMTTALSDQLTKTIEIIRLQLIRSRETIYILETHLIHLREQAAAAAATPTPSEETIGSSPMPEHEVPQLEQRYEVETQTSESLQAPRAVAVMVESSMQTKDTKPTENIFVTQTQSEGHETIKFESAPNPNVEEYTEDVFVDAKYKQPNDPHKATELILRNVPQTSFETLFVEPDNTTTEVVVDADGRKQIIVRKVTRTVQQQQVIEQKQQHTKIESLVGPDNQPIEQNISQSSTEDHSVITSVTDGKGSKTVKTKKTKVTHATGDAPDQLVVQEVIEKPITTEVITTDAPAFEQQYLIGSSEMPHEQSSVQTVVHHVTQRIIRRKRKIIRKVTIIDGVEHVTEEVIEEPEEIEVTEDQIPGVNINVVQYTSTETPIVELPADDEQIVQSELEIINEPVIIDAPETSDKENQGKKVPASKKVKEEQNTQVLDFEPTAPVDLVDNAPVVADLPVASSICDVNITQLPAQTIVVEQTIETESPVVEDIFEIWPKDQPSVVSLPSHETSVHESIHTESPKDDSVPSEKIWPIDDKTGHTVTLETYTFEQQQQQEQEPEQPSIVETPEHSPKEESIKTPDKSESQQLVVEMVQLAPETVESIEIHEEISQPEPEPESLQKDSDHSDRTFEIEQRIEEAPKLIEQEEPVEKQSEPSQSDSSPKTFTIEKDKRKKKKNKKGAKQASPTEEESGHSEQVVEIREEITMDVEKPQTPVEEKPEPQLVETVETIQIEEIPQPSPKPDSAAFIEQEKYDIKVIESPEQIEQEPADEVEKVEPETREKSEPEKSSSTSSSEKNKRKKKKNKKGGKGTSSEGDSEPKDQPEESSHQEEVVEISKVEEILPEKPVEAGSKEVIIETEVIIQQQTEPVIVIDEPTEAAPVEEPQKEEPAEDEPKPKTKTIDVRSVTQLFIDNELNVSDGTTRTVKLTMSPNEPSSPGSVQVKMQKVENVEQQPKLNVNLIEERLQSELVEPMDPSVADSTELHVTDDDNTISEKMEMPEIETTPVPTEQFVISTEQMVNISPESYKSISELEGQVKVVEENVVSPESDSPKPMGAEIIIATDILEEQQTEDVHQQTDPINLNVEVVAEKPASSARSMQTTPEPEKILIDEELQTTPTKQETFTDIEVQTSPIAMTPEVPETKVVEQVVTVHEEVCF